MRRPLLAAAGIALLFSAVALPAAAAPLDPAKIVLPSAIGVDLAANTVTLPLHRGTARGRTVWYVLTDASDRAAASRLGILYAPLLANIGAGAQAASGSPDALVFSGGVDFTPQRSVALDAYGAVGDATPGSVGDAAYSPFVRAGEIVYNAPIVAAGEHPADVTTHADTLDRVVAIRTGADAQVTLLLARGYAHGKRIAYISTDASAAGPAAIERSTFAPLLAKAASGSRIPIYVFFDGSNGADGQGIAFSALHGGLTADATPANAASLGSPLNLPATFPGDPGDGYTPLWGVEPAIWTAAAVAGGSARRVTRIDEITDAAARGLITAPDGGPLGIAPISVNCPIVAFTETRP